MTYIVDLWNDLRARTGDEKAQGLAEYALVLALIAVMAVGALVFLGAQITDILSQIGTSI